MVRLNKKRLKKISYVSRIAMNQAGIDIIEAEWLTKENLSTIRRVQSILRNKPKIWGL